MVSLDSTILPLRGSRGLLGCVPGVTKSTIAELLNHDQCQSKNSATILPTSATNLRIYGTLMAAPLLAWVLTGSSGNATSVLSQRKRARVSGFTRRPVRGFDYPALIRASDSEVDGFLVFPKDQAEWNKLDNFEGEAYDRTLVHAVDEGGEVVEVHVYLWAGPEDALDEGDWDFGIFERERLEDWLMLFDGMEMVG